MIVIGIDPGARYTGVVVRDMKEDTILLSSTYVKPEEEGLITWAVRLADMIQEDVVNQHLNATIIGLEGMSDPKGYNRGRKSPINPKYLVRAGIILGVLADRFRHNLVIVPPGKNGSSRTGYPDALNGRRPKDLPGVSKGAGTRNHEKSAYDVAGGAMFLHKQNYTLDSKNELPI